LLGHAEGFSRGGRVEIEEMAGEDARLGDARFKRKRRCGAW
jgi:hypothetical protein